MHKPKCSDSRLNNFLTLGSVETRETLYYVLVLEKNNEEQGKKSEKIKRAKGKWYIPGCFISHAHWLFPWTFISGLCFGKRTEIYFPNSHESFA